MDGSKLETNSKGRIKKELNKNSIPGENLKLILLLPFKNMLILV